MAPKYKKAKTIQQRRVIRQAQELKDSDLLNIKKKSKLDPDSMISTSELYEIYEVPTWVRFKIMEASRLKPIMRCSGRVYFYKNDIIPVFESYKAGTLTLKPRKK